MKKNKTITAAEFDKKFDRGDDISDYVDWNKAVRGGATKPYRFSVDCPHWMIRELDREAGHLGVTRQSMIKIWLAERLENIQKLRLQTATA